MARSFSLTVAIPAWIAILSVTSVAEAGKSTQAPRTAAAAQDQDVTDDLGDMKEPVEKPVEFRGNINAHVDYTSNAKQTGNHTSGDVLFFPTISAGLNAKLGKKVTFDLEAKVESIFYARYDERAFAGYSFAATLDYRPKANMPRIYVGLDPYRYDSFDTGDLISQAVGLSAGTDYGFAFNNGNSLALVGYTFTNYFTDPHMDSRSAHKAVVGVTHKLGEKLYGQALYMYQFTDYQEVDREDSRHIALVNVTYQINKHLFSNVSATFVDSDSTQDKASYQSVGTSLGFTYQF